MPSSLSLKTLQDALASLGLQPEPTPNAGRPEIFCTLPCPPQGLPTFCKVIEEGAFIQILTLIPYQLDLKKTLCELARYLHRLNKDIDAPGFGLDENKSLVFYRLLLPCKNQELDIPLLQAYLYTSQTACSKYLSSIQSVARGHAACDDFANGR